jgi:PAS domain S-box-containing protein
MTQNQRVKTAPREEKPPGDVVFAEAQHSRQQLITVLENITDGFAFLDADWNIIYVNPAAQQLVGKTASDLLGRNHWEAFPGSIGTKIESEYRRAMAEHVAVDFEEYYASAQRWFKIKAFPSVPTGLSICFRDVTERKRAEEEFARRSAQFTAFVQTASIGLHWVAEDGEILWANPAEAALLGYPLDEYIGRNIREFHADPETITDILNSLARGECLMNREARLKCKDGSIKDVLIDSKVLWENGEFIHTQCFTRDITELKRAEEALRRNEERFRLAAHSEAITLYEQDQDLRYTWLYPSHPEHEGALGRTDAELLPDEQGELLMSLKREVMRTGRPTREEIRISLTGRTRYYDLFISPRRNLAGEVLGVSGASLEITDRKRADDASVRLAAIVESSDDAIVRKDLRGIILSWNRGAERIFGYTEEEVIGKPITILIPPERQQEEQMILGRLSRGERIDHFETVRLRKDGTRLDISVTVSPIRNAEGKVIGASKIARDITEHKRSLEQGKALHELVEAANRARSLPELFQAALSSIRRTTSADRAAILLYDTDDVMRFKAWDGLSEGYRQSVEGHSPWKRSETNPRPVCIEDVATAALPEELRHVVTKEGIGSLAFIPIAYEQRLLGKFMVYYNRSKGFAAEQIRSGETIATQVAFGIQRQRAGEALERLVSERTASLREAVLQMEEFSYTVSHDLRAPLRAMQGYSDALIEDFRETLPSAALQFAQRISGNAARLDKMVLDLLTFSRVARAELPLTTVTVRKVLRNVIEQYPGLQAGRAEIDVGQMRDVQAHEPALTQVFANLLTNAVKFSRPGVPPKVRIWGEARGERERIWIEDNGIGIAPSLHYRLFRMFERIHPDLPYEGNGVGLAIVRKAVERMGGSVGVESDGVNGSRFWIELNGSAVK